MSGVSGIMMGNVPTKVLTFLGATGDTANATSYTFAAQNLGTVYPDRRIIVVMSMGHLSSAPTITSATIGGVSATLVTEGAFTNGYVKMIIANVPTGTTGDIVINVDNTVIYCTIGMYHTVGLQSNTPYYYSNNKNAYPTLLCMSGGICVSIAGGDTSGINTTWLTLTEDYDVDFDTDRVSGASFYPTVAPTIDISSNGNIYGIGATW